MQKQAKNRKTPKFLKSHCFRWFYFSFLSAPKFRFVYVSVELQNSYIFPGVWITAPGSSRCAEAAEAERRLPLTAGLAAVKTCNNKVMQLALT